MVILLLFFGCANDGTENNLDSSTSNTKYKIHKNITVTTFWVGEKASSENGFISNIASAWDENWTLHYGGEDTPNSRKDYYPLAFTPKQNSFYFALPYNDLDESGEKKSNRDSIIPWAKLNNNTNTSICENRWIKITKGVSVAYAQWKDVGPFGEDDSDYVFGNSQPKNTINNHAGLDVSPAVKDYLSLSDIDTITWEFVNDSDVPYGPWKTITKEHTIPWKDWYRPKNGVSWQWQLQGDINSSYNVKIYDIDLFDSNSSLINYLQQSGKKVICYFSAGSYEKWRKDSVDFPESVLGNKLDGWVGERWLDISNPAIKPIMLARLDLALNKGCDGIEPDNVDGYMNNSGFDLTSQQQLDYNKFIANEARKRGLSVGLKNDLSQIEKLKDFFDFSVNEECHEFNECQTLLPFIKQNKPVLNAEYSSKYINNTDGARDILCTDAQNNTFSTLILPLYLNDTFRFSCNYE